MRVAKKALEHYEILVQRNAAPEFIISYLRLSMRTVLLGLQEIEKDEAV